MHTTEIVLSFPRPSNQRTIQPAHHPTSAPSNQRTIQRAQSIHLNNSFAKTL